MFTGLIQELGKIDQIRPIREGKEIDIYCPALLPKIKVDDSVAVNGVCQTVVAISSQTFKVQCVSTSLQKTTLGQLSPGQTVNLELSLRLGDRLGGHLVHGHVNGVGKILRMQKLGDNHLIWIRTPRDLGPYMVKEGPICLDGISLTVADKSHQDICVSVIPHSLHHTNFKNKKIGDLINIEVDILAKYVENLLSQPSHKSSLERYISHENSF